MLQVFLSDDVATEALGERLARSVPPGGVLAVSGELGAGKTCLARGFGRGLGVPGVVRSPTFALLQLHEGGRLDFAHLDVYRLGDATELPALGLDEVLARGGCALIEWADRFPEALPEDRIDLALGVLGDARTASIVATGPVHARWLERANVA